jgi:hypothetical protein
MVCEMSEVLKSSKNVNLVVFIIVVVALLAVIGGTVLIYNGMNSKLQNDNSVLQAQQQSLQSNYTALQNSYNDLLNNYNVLVYQNGQLQTQYNALNSSFGALQAENDELSQIANLSKIVMLENSTIIQMNGNGYATLQYNLNYSGFLTITSTNFDGYFLVHNSNYDYQIMVPSSGPPVSGTLTVPVLPGNNVVEIHNSDPVIIAVVLDITYVY